LCQSFCIHTYPPTFVCSIFLRALSSSFCINAIRFLYNDHDNDALAIKLMMVMMLVNKHDYYVSDDNGVCAQLFPQQFFLCTYINNCASLAAFFLICLNTFNCLVTFSFSFSWTDIFFLLLIEYKIQYDDSYK
jgi:hypothetical protein